MTYSSEVLADSPLVYYRLGEASGTSLTDSSGNGRTGSYVGSPTLGTTGLLVGDADTCVDLSGSGQYAQYGTPATGLGVTRLTVEAWVNLDNVTSYRDVVGRRDAAGGANESWQMRVTSSGKLDFFIVSGSTYYTSFQSTASLSTGTKYHLVATYDGSNVRLYINGSLDSTFAHTADPNTNASTAALRIGYSGFSGSPEYLDGRVDEVAVYGTALSGTRISAHYNAGSAGNASGSGSLSLSGSGAAGSPAAADGSIALSGSGAAVAPVSGSGSLDLSGAGAILFEPAAGDGSITLAGSGGAGVGVSGSGSVVLTGDGAALASEAASGTGSITLTGQLVAGIGAAGSGLITLSGDGAASPLYTTDLSNALDGLGLLLTATVTFTPAVVAPPAPLGVKYDKAIAYPVPVMVNGRPT